jgi:hypothetical protein
MSNLKWLACQGVELNPYNLSVPERLEKFGYALIFDEFGNGRVDKAQLCIHNVLAATTSAKPANILIICPESLMQIWHSLLLADIGADFKFISGAGDSVVFYSANISNLFIIGEEKLRNPAISSGLMGKSDVVWDLMIIDAGLAADGVDWAGYYSNCKNKTHTLLAFAPCPFPHDADVNSSMTLLKEMLKTFLRDEAKKGSVNDLGIDETVVNFRKDTPVTRYYVGGKVNPNVVVCEYEIDHELFNAENRLIDIHTGVPYYTYGGNVFEEFEPALKNKYMRPRYDGNDVDKLRKADAKLNLFLEKLEDALKVPANNVVIYFTSPDTLGYIQKVINALYPDLLREDKIIVRTDSVMDGRFLKLRLSGEDAEIARITLATDLMGEHYHGMGKVTHVFNYEYPENPAELERRFSRTTRGENGLCTADEFVVFVDKDGKFDGRILSKVMFGGLYRCFKTKIPSQNVLFWIPEAERYLVDTIADLKDVIYKSKGASAEHARSFCANYNVADRGLVSTAGKAAVYAEQILDKLVSLLDIEKHMPGVGETLNTKLLTELIRENIMQLRNGYVFYADIGHTKSRVIENPNSNFAKIVKEYENCEMIKGVKSAKAELEGMLKKCGDGKYPPVREMLEQIPEGLKTPTLYNIWRYCKLNKGHKNSLKEFIEQFNEGAI